MQDVCAQPSLKLVLIDDHDGAREALVRRLGADSRIEVVGATPDPSEGRRLVEEHRPDAALVDTRRKDEAGAAVISALASLPEEARPLVVVHTSFFDAEDWRLWRAAGAQDWLLKQIDVNVLFERLTAALREHLSRANCAPAAHAGR
jgi:DNA-binding NarL/FixJ family response regulator